MRTILLATLVALAYAAVPVTAQDAVPSAAPEDVESVDALVAALYDVISGPAGERDWDRFRSLFAPGALLVPAAPRPDGSAPLRALTVDGYVTAAGGFFAENAFYEVESAREETRFGHVVSRMSAYESRRDPSEEPFARGINAITLVRDDDRWYVVSIAWDVDREGNEIPDGFGAGK